MRKIKHAHGGLRGGRVPLAQERPLVGSLLLGLYDGDQLRHVGVAASFPMARRKTLVDEPAPYRKGAEKAHPWHSEVAGKRTGGTPSRWNAERYVVREPLRPELVVEVGYDHMEGPRFRHTAQFKRWRPDRDPKTCTYEQLEQPVRYDLAELLST